MPISKKMKLAIIGTLAVAIVAVPLGTYLASGDETLDAETSPDGRYKLEVRSATRWQVVTHSIADQLVYARLHLPSGKKVDSSPFDASGVGPTLWTKDGGVQIGTTAIYEPQNERWSVEW
ncbi:hypothetical protein [Sphingomonas sp. S2-65]|uniref:hypothetical protein n=1 Tax=Sphingomonas sp. S2-65 TaxID=2903960 RepID=UPI001F27930B|nr:hypothetical protein [Sphingomonas sp. S2-65]UYY58613.1 hypothetical protein LZ586_00385 [Sphingomonas sp. S2-65]